MSEKIKLLNEELKTYDKVIFEFDMDNQEEKQLLLKDICARLPYGVIYHRNDGANIELREVDINNGILNYTDNIVVRECKPYLRTMSSMTKEEEKELGNYVAAIMFASQNKDPLFQLTREAFLGDFFNKRHFDYRGLIEKGLALEAPDDMYKIK